jgi:hypothetical protein
MAGGTGGGFIARVWEPLVETTNNRNSHEKLTTASQKMTKSVILPAMNRTNLIFNQIKNVYKDIFLSH